MSLQIHHDRPRVLNWRHAASLLFGDWGTSRLYVLGLAFFYSGRAAPWHVLAMCALLAAVAWAYTIVCRCFHDGGGVYSAAKSTNQRLALLGAYLLFADYLVTAALSAFEAVRYFGVPAASATPMAIGALLLMGVVNFIGPRSAGRLATTIASFTLVIVFVIAVFCVPHLSWSGVTADRRPVGQLWTSFVQIILALSGVEAIANMTGVMVEPVDRTSRRAIWMVLAEVVFFNLIFAVAMNGLPDLPGGILAEAGRPLTHEEEGLRDTMMSSIAHAYVPIPYFSTLAAGIFGLLLLSAVNTAVAAMINVQYALARDEELPAVFLKLNVFGVPWIPLAAACAICSALLALTGNVEQLAHLYAIGVVGAIMINLGSTCFNPHVQVSRAERAGLGVLALFLAVVEVTIAVQKPEAAIFAGTVIVTGFLLRLAVRKAPVYTPYVPRIAEAVTRLFQAPEPEPGAILTGDLKPFDPMRPKILVASRGNESLIRFAADEAARREANLLVLFVRDIALSPGPAAIKTPDPARDPEALKVFSLAQAEARARDIPLVPIYCVSRSSPEMILDFAATYAVDFLILGVSRRGAMYRVLRGDVITQVADHLPAETTLLIHA